MSCTLFTARHWIVLVAALAVGMSAAAPMLAQGPAAQPASAPSPLTFNVSGTSQRLEMIVNTSRILTLDKKVPRIQVNNPEILRAQPLSPYKIQVAALRPGVTQVNLWDEDDTIHTVDIVVFGDARELQMLLETEFPNSALKVRPLASSVVISGFVDKPEAVSRIVRMAEDYYPKIINNITVGGVQQVLLHVKVLEVSRSKLRTMGFDWAAFSGNDFVVQTASGILAPPELQVGGGITGNLVATTDTIRFGIVDGGNAFFGFLEALRTYNMAKLLAEPTLVTVSGRPASFNVGGEFPILVPGGLGTVSIEYKQFGTRVDFVPIVLGNGNIRLEVRPSVTERDDAAGVNGVPAVRSRWVDTAAEMRAGQTLALAGLVQNRVETSNTGIPLLADLPWVGAAFRRVESRMNEVELLVMVTPELVGPMSPHEVPQCLPGQFTKEPNDCELYGKGYLEVPKCCDGVGMSCQDGGCLNCNGGAPMYGPGPSYGPGPAAAPGYGPSPAEAPVENYQPTSAARTPANQLQNPVRAQPVSTRTPAPVARTPATGQQNPQARYIPQGRPTPPSSNATPGLIGPVGYDVLD